MTTNSFTTKGKERERQTRKEQVKGRKAVTGEPTRARTLKEQAKGRKAAKLSTRKLAEIRKKKLHEHLTATTGVSIPNDHWKRSEPPPIDPSVIPNRVQEEAAVINARYEPHPKLSFHFELLRVPPEHERYILSRITDGISEAIRIVLAQHSFKPLDGHVFIETVTVPQPQKETTNGE